MSERLTYVNGQIAPESESFVSVRDKGFVYGDAVFDTARTFGGKLFRLNDHIDRSRDMMTIRPAADKKRHLLGVRVLRRQAAEMSFDGHLALKKRQVANQSVDTR